MHSKSGKNCQFAKWDNGQQKAVEIRKMGSEFHGFLENSSEVSLRNGFCFYSRLTAFSQSNRSRYTRRTMLERLQVRGYAQEIMPNSWMNFKITVT